MVGRRHSVFKQILVGFDGSEQSRKAANTAISLAHCLDAKVLVLAVARPPEPATSVELEAVLDNAKEHFEAAFVPLRESAKNAEVEMETDIAVGHPAEQIIHRAEQSKMDLIVLGCRGTSTFHRWILGSVSEKVLRYAHCPVMVLR
ncbi:MAG TPA: universal stress protein [Candidatus Angelobacter sp.]|nr:universal stress protein [Candidatus Angelobacter sp.]